MAGRGRCLRQDHPYRKGYGRIRLELCRPLVVWQHVERYRFLVLDEEFRRGSMRFGEYGLLAVCGPGFSVESRLLRWSRQKPMGEDRPVALWASTSQIAGRTVPLSIADY